MVGLPHVELQSDARDVKVAAAKLSPDAVAKNQGMRTRSSQTAGDNNREAKNGCRFGEVDVKAGRACLLKR